MTDILTVTPKEAARRLGIGLTTVYELLRVGRLPAIKVGTRPNYRIPLRAIEECLGEPERLNPGTERGTRRAE